MASSPDILGDLLERLCQAEALPARIDAFAELIAWTRRGAARWDLSGDPGQTIAVTDRLSRLVLTLQGDQSLRERFSQAITAILAEADGTNLFGVAGIPVERGFLAEASDRILAQVLPRPRDDHDLARVLRRLFPSALAVRRFERIPDASFQALVQTLAPAEQPGQWQPIRRAFADGFRLLALRTAGHGLEPRLRERGGAVRVADDPFLRLQRSSDALVAAWESGGEPTPHAPAWRDDVAGCQRRLAAVRTHLEDGGVNVDIVFAIDVIERCLVRMQDMVAIMLAGPGLERSRAIHALLARLVLRHHQDRSVGQLASANLRLLHRRIVDRSGETGGHYIAGSAAEYRHIWLAAMGGGILTTATAAVKLAIHHLAHAAHVAPAATGMLFGLNYAASFVAMQHLGLMLATKQPAMTAAALAGVLRGRTGEDRIERVVDQAAAICSSQLAAAAGNVLMVSAGAVAMDTLWRLMTGHHWVQAEEVEALYLSLSPIASGTIFYAAVTGVVLWASSIIGGWVDNFAVYHRLPQGIAEHPVGVHLGRDRMLRWGEAVRTHAAGWGTNISLGLMLGMLPAFGLFLGIPLDVRHVTLNSGMFAFAACAHDGPLLSWQAIWAVAGIACMFVLNLSVSFALSLFTAARAFDLPFADLLLVLRGIALRLLRRPHQFAMPPKG
jgi:site-specific recombinase